MLRLEDLQPNATVQGILPNSLVTVVSVQWFGSEALELTYKSATGKVANELLYRDDEVRLELVEQGRPWSFDGDGGLFRLVSEAQRISLAHLFDPVLAVHTSLVDPLPHQITAVYETMLPRQPLRFLLADDPGAGKTIMAGLLIKELIARGDLQRCLIVCPGSLAEQWQDELYRRFHLPFEILTNDKLEAARTGNWFLESNLVIARLDKLSRDESVQEKLKTPDCRWDLIVCDEAHKMSATVFGGEVKYTKRYRLGQLLSTLTRHFLLMTATPHNGKEEDFQLFMALLDGDRFEGRFRDGTHVTDVSDLMRRMVKEKLLKFDSTRLFPERIAYTMPYKLSDAEARLYKEVTDYVREEFNRAEKLENDKRAGTVGFALTILQRRLASSPEAIYQSLRRRRERLESRLRELEILQRGSKAALIVASEGRVLDAEAVEDLEEAPADELDAVEEEILDQATAARSMSELRAEIETLKRLEASALAVRRSGKDTKWRELASLLGEIFTPAALGGRVGEIPPPYVVGPIPPPVSSPHQKLVLFTEHRDTLNYLENRITTLLGRSESVVMIHGGMGREQRMKAQESFKHDPQVQVLLATDAAGEGINLQRAHLMVNYDLPWNPNRIEQRFGRIHRIGQTEVCHLWNLVAEETREGDVYRRLLDKLEQARQSLGGQVFDVLGKLQFEGKSLRELLIEAIRYGDKPETRAYLTTVLENALDRGQLEDLLEDRALAQDVMDVSRVQRIRADMERAEARRLQPHYIESFFLEAFQRLSGNAKQREPRRYEITHVPATVRNRDRLIGIGEPVLPRYERIAFEKDLVAPQGQPLAAFVCPGHPLLDSVIDITLERNRDLLKRGAVLIDERDSGTQPRVLFTLEHAIQDASLTRNGERRVISKRMLYTEIDSNGAAHHVHYAPYLDYRPLTPEEPGVDALLARPECAWITRELEGQAQAYAIAQVVPEHLKEVRNSRLTLIAKTEAAVKERLTKEITYWDHRAAELKLQEQAGKPNARLNSGEARKRADGLESRLQKRLDELKREAQISPLPPVALGGVLIIPIGLIAAMRGEHSTQSAPKDTLISAARARAIIMQTERHLGFEPTDREFEKLGYDIESCIPNTGQLRFIEVKGRVAGADVITVTRNEILYSLNKPDDFILAIVEFISDDSHRVHYLRRPFQREPDFGVTSVNYNFAELLSRAESPR
jgi:SNF2 family DNA or RNA helicase